MRALNGFREQIDGASADDQRHVGGQRMTQSADFLSSDLAGNAAIEEQQNERGVIRLRGRGDFLRGNAGAEREAAHAFAVKQIFENREAKLIRIVRRRRQQYLPRIAQGTGETAAFAQQALRKICEAQFLERLHFAAYDALVHSLVQWNQRLLEKLAQSLRAKQLRQMILQIDTTMRCQHADRRFDFRGQRRRLLDGKAQHRLKRGVGERNDCAGAPSFREQLLDETQARNLPEGFKFCGNCGCIEVSMNFRRIFLLKKQFKIKYYENKKK